MTGHLSQACLGLLEFSKILQFPGLNYTKCCPKSKSPSPGGKGPWERGEHAFNPGAGETEAGGSLS